MSDEEGPERRRRGRFISFDDDDELFEAQADPARTARTLRRAAVASTVGLLVVAGTSVWTAVAFARRGRDDIEVTHRISDGPGNPPQLPDKAKYTTSFLLKAELPFLIAVLVCGAAFIWWHATVDQAAREQEDMLATERWKVIGGWFFPGANLVFPIRSLRELTSVHGARPAELIAVPWWALTVTATLINFFMLRTGAQSSTGPHKDQSGVEGLDGLDKYGVFVGCANLVGALLAVALVWNLTTAVRARITDG
ncbi:MAG TPA: DUF4328 domain-containing protein [Sporichthyaceae bacterium]|nr:DUF4328 domain-containing protein [Sporichthyaceae bacterium]